MKASHQFDDTIDVYNCAHKTISKPNKIYLPLIETIPCRMEKKHFDWNTNHSDEEKNETVWPFPNCSKSLSTCHGAEVSCCCT